MTIRKFQASTMHEALGEVKRMMGSDAVILHTRTFKCGGILGLGTREMVEITASDEGRARPERKKAHGKISAPAGAYASAARLMPSPDGPGENPLLSGVRLDISGVGKPSPPAPDSPPPAPLRTPPQLRKTPRPRQQENGDLIHKELRALKAMVQDVARTSIGSICGDLPRPLARVYRKLLDCEVSEGTAWDVVTAVRSTLPCNAPPDFRQVCVHTFAETACRIRTAEPITPTPGTTHAAVFFGPTGVGKTTTIAKLAADFALNRNMKVGLITIDTYRIAAVEQLRTYARIINVPLTVVNTPGELARALALHRGADVVLVDTAGRSQRDAEKMDELEKFIRAGGTSEKLLVASASSHRKTLMEVIDRFSYTNPDKLILSKIDEAAVLGPVLDVCSVSDVPIAYYTTGQEVPDDIEVAKSDVLAELILESGGPDNA